MVRITEIPQINLAKFILSNVEIVVYLTVPLSVPAQKAYNIVKEKIGTKKEEDEKKEIWRTFAFILIVAFLFISYWGCIYFFWDKFVVYTMKAYLKKEEIWAWL